MAKAINTLLSGFRVGICWLLVCGLPCLAKVLPEAENTPEAAASDRIVYLTGLLIILGALFLWHRWRFVSGRKVLSPVMMSCPTVTVERSALVPQFIQWLKSHAVQQLIVQREELLTTQQLAEMELAKLEQMLAAVHAPLQHRIREYEKRIADLEQALKTKDEHGAQLIETMIRLTRQKLETERAKR